VRALEDFVAAQPGIAVTFATGRTLASAVSALEESGARPPQHLVTDVGTAIHHRTDDRRWAEDGGYARFVEALWDAPGVEGWAARPLPADVRRQPGVHAGRRLPLELVAGGDLHEAARRVRKSLAQAGLAADVLPSSGWCLDVLPAGVHKGTAVEHLRRVCRLPETLVVCGDSENDLGMLRIADVPVLMPESHLRPNDTGIPPERVVVPREPGPRGILDVLRGLAARRAIGPPGRA
jgi:hydroxymethylpyrimidine pyrophosphatase-like HAD family hydrolase